MSKNKPTNVQNTPRMPSGLADADYPAGDILSSWRERLLIILLRSGVVVGLMALAASVVYDLQVQDWVNIAVTVAAYGFLLVITFLRIPYRLKAGILVFLLFALTLNSLLTSGIRGEARMFCIIFTLLTLMLLGVRAGWIALGVSLLSVAGAAWATVTQRLTLAEPYDQLNISPWILSSSTMLLVIVLLMLGVILLQREFMAAQQREEKALADVNQERELLESRVSERTRELSLAVEVGRSVSQLRDLDTLLPNAVELIRSQFNLYYAQIYLMDAAGRMLTLRVGTGGVGAELLRRGHRLPVGPGSINGVAAAECKTIIVADTASNPIFRPNPLLPETRSELAVPLLVGERVVGVLDLQSRYPGALSVENLSAFEALAGQLAIALDNAALFAQTEQTRLEVEEQTRHLALTGWKDFLNAVERSERIGYLYDQNSLTPFNTPLPQTQAENTVKSPIIVTGAAVGTVQLERAGDQPWQPEEIDLVTAVVGQAARQLDNLRLLAQAESYRSDAEQATRRLTREGWAEYLQTRSEQNGYVYDQTTVQPLRTLAVGERHSQIERTVEQAAAARATAEGADADGTAYRADADGTAYRADADGTDHRDTDSAYRAAVKVVVQPLQLGAEMVGELAFDGVEALDPASTELVSNVANLLASHIEGLRLTEQTQKALIETEQLYSASAELNTARAYAEILEVLRRHTLVGKGAHVATISLFNRPWSGNDMPEWVEVEAIWNEQSLQGIMDRFPLASFPSALATLHPNFPTMVENVLEDTRLDEAARVYYFQLHKSRSVIFIPLVAGGQWIGFIFAGYGRSREFPTEEVRRTLALAGQSAVAVNNLRLLAETQALAQREKNLRQITALVRGSTNADTILRTATRELGTVLGRKVKVQLGEKL
jgi:GAF domain-containing protein